MQPALRGQGVIIAHQVVVLGRLDRHGELAAGRDVDRQQPVVEGGWVVRQGLGQDMAVWVGPQPVALGAEV